MAEGRYRIWHNPSCGTSRNALAALRDAGAAVEVIPYLQVGWRADELADLIARTGLRPSDVLRTRGTPAEELGLTAPGTTQERILAAMVEHPILVERPIVETPVGVALCRPWQKVLELLPA